MTKKDWKCGYDGTKKKLADGRCAACGRSSLAESKRDADAWDRAARTKHTPTPWKQKGRVVRGPERDVETIGISLSGSTSNLRKVKMESAVGSCFTEEDAAFIVRAVNAHEEMLEALCLVDAHFEAHFGKLNWEDSEICADVRRAIAKAEGGPRA